MCVSSEDACVSYMAAGYVHVSIMMMKLQEYLNSNAPPVDPHVKESEEEIYKGKGFGERVSVFVE